MTASALPVAPETLPTNGFLLLTYGVRIAAASCAIVLMLSDAEPSKWLWAVMAWGIFALTLLAEARLPLLRSHDGPGNALVRSVACACLAVGVCLMPWAVLVEDYASMADVARMTAIQSGMILGWLIIQPLAGRGTFSDVARRVYIVAAALLGLISLALADAGPTLLALVISLAVAVVLGWHFTTSGRVKADPQD